MKSKATLLWAAAAFAALLAAPAALAADLTDVGYLDQAAVGALPEFQRANAQVMQYKSQLDPQFAAAMKRARNDADKQRISGEFQQKFLDKQRQVLGPLFARAQTAIAQVASNMHLSVVVDKRIVVFGGQNITKSVVDLVNGPGPVVPPASTPPPATIGFVDQSQIDQLPKIKAANDNFLKFASDARQGALQKMQAAKNNQQQQQQIFQAYQKSLTDEQNRTLKPLVDQTRNAMASVAQGKHLILVIDRADIIYGGTDITADVQNALK
jgi:outer membrane protein